MRADRLISIMMLLQVHRRLTARDLADRLEVSERTIHRDMEALSTAGIPVYAERGVGGGWSLVDGYETNLTGLSDAEIQTLFLSKPQRLLTDLGLHSASESAMNKLLAALPAMQRQDAESIQQRVHIDVNGWSNTQETVAYLPLLQQAIWQERRIKIVYELSTGPIVTPDLDPLGLVAKGNTWYLVAVYKGNNAVYRVSRIFNACLLDEPCQRPKEFDLAAFWAESSAHFFANLPRYPVEVLVRPDTIDSLRCWRRAGNVERVSPPEADGRQRVTLVFESEEEACAQCLSFGAQVEVVTPYPLRQMVIERAKATVAQYAHHMVAPHPRQLAA
ncbi:MAG: YafY family transcriptional regulator [Caldilineaceae bacterium]|nr:YafY family transcriptional regulator [Caldilineaceae bacterium]